MSARRAGCRRAAAGVAMLAALPAVARASGSEARPTHGGDGVLDACATRTAASPPRAPRAWPAPLDRMVTPARDEQPLARALDGLVAAARVRLTYSPELLPVGRRVCLPAQAVPLGDALVALLDGTGVAPVVAGPEQVVLVPARVATAADAVPTGARPPAQLERVVVTGSATGGAERASPFALTLIERDDLADEGAGSLAGILDASVPGIWMWTQLPTSPLARYGSVRGASSFGVTAPKIYVDGIEVANPILLTHVDPARVERVEVIRGPQGAALYGADAISGVVQIVTRNEGVSPATPRVELRASAGNAASSFASGGVLTQDHALVLRAGSAARSASVGVTLSTLGAYVPQATARRVLLHGGARWLGTNVVATGTARFYAGDADAPISPLLSGVTPTLDPYAARAARAAPPSGDGAVERGVLDGAFPRGAAQVADPDTVSEQRVRQYTLGGTVTTTTSERWTHAVTAGIDGYRLSGVPLDGMLVPSAVDSALVAARGGADRATLRASSTARFGAPEGRALTLTLGAEHSTAREATNGVGTRLVSRVAAPTDGTADGSGYAGAHRATGDATTWWRNTGLLAQAQVVLADALFLTGGGRVEHVSGSVSAPQVELLPLLGVSWVREHGALALKLRAAYGRGIRQPRTVARGATWMGGRVDGALAELEPETQAGVEAGADLLWGRHLALHVTRFDQRVSGLVQPVALLDPAARGAGAPDVPSRPYGELIMYQLQNVGAIDNRGWEVEARATPGPLALAATLSLVDSRVARIAPSYRGDLRAGDRMLEVPARTLGMSADWRARRWSAGLALARAWDWVNYDRLALAGLVAEADAAGLPASRLPLGAPLRDYWRTYDGVTRLGARGTVALARGLSLTLAAENILDHQVGEPDNVTVTPGRTISLGVRTGF